MLSPLRPEDHLRIEAAVTEIERRVAVDFAVIVVRASDRYSLYPPLWGGLGAVAVTAIVAMLWPALPIRAGIPIEVAVFIVLTLVFDWMPIRLRLAPDRIRKARASQLARREFAAHALAGESSRSGIVLFVSIGERYVEIIADRAIHAQVAKGTWDKIVADFVTTAKAGRIAEGMLAAIEACGAALMRAA